MGKAKGSKRKKIIVFTLIVLTLGGLGAAAWFKKKEVIITVQTEKVTPRTLTELVVANGRIYPVLQVKISPEVSGEIIELAVKEGQRVKKGDLLVRIKPDNYEAAVRSSEASFNSAQAGRTTSEANLRKAELDFKRVEQLYKSTLISEADLLTSRTSFEIAAAQLESSKQQVEMARASLVRAKEDLAKTTIFSPLDGTISRLNSQLGERVVGTAMMAGTEIMVVADLNEMEARVDIGEIDVVLIQMGQKARLEVDAYKDRKFSGLVTEIANSSKGMGTGGGGGGQEATKFEVKIRITDKDPFRPGMTVTAEVETRSRTNVLTVPIASVTTRLPKPPSTNTPAGKPGEKKAESTNTTATGTSTNTPAATATTNTPDATASTNAVKVPDGKKNADQPKPIEVVFLVENDLAKMVPVKRGISDDSYVEITEGLKEGQAVVSGGYRAISKDLEDGKRVKVGVPEKEKEKPGEPKP